MLKAMFFDLDRTLLLSSGKLSEKTKKALHICKNKEIKIFVATARAPLLRKMLSFSDEEEYLLNEGGIFYNGGYICCSLFESYNPISQEAISKVLDIISDYNDVNISIQFTKDKHSFKYELTESEYSYWGFKKGEDTPFEEFSRNEVLKVTIFSKSLVNTLDNIPSSLYDSLRNEISPYEANIYLTDMGKVVQIVGANVSKRSAVEKIIKAFDIKPEEIAVFGDDYTDAEMLSAFENSVAMGNACDEVKSYAKHVTLSNDNDGIYYALRSILKVI